MSNLDWVVLFCTLMLIILYGVWKSHGAKNISGFLLADRKLSWYHVGFSVMATQASAITFLSLPGQAYSDGLRFIQFYFGLPLAMVVLCVTFIPAFSRLNVYTAYEFLEKRFDGRTRLLTAFLFLLQRGLSTGVAIIAPSIILSSILGIHSDYTILFIGGVVILYTVYGGTKAVSHTQVLQMLVVFTALFISAAIVLRLLPENTGIHQALKIAGSFGKTAAIDTHFDWSNKYNLWSGIIGGFFLQLSYFGTDQSQVGRYLTGRSVRESRLGLLLNGFVKLPMQFLILLTGVLVFVFYQFNTPPVFFNHAEIRLVKSGPYAEQFAQYEQKYQAACSLKTESLHAMSEAMHSHDSRAESLAREEVRRWDEKANSARNEALRIIRKNNAGADVNDTDYIFLHFVMSRFPHGMIGLLIAVIFLASMGSTASGLNSLASTSVVDVYKKLIHPDAGAKKDLLVSRISTLLWGLFCVVVAFYAKSLGNLIEAVNILGSFFYGTVLGVFLVAFYLKKVQGTAVFYAALIAQICVILAWYFNYAAFLWLNVIGCVMVMGVALLIQLMLSYRAKP